MIRLAGIDGRGRGFSDPLPHTYNLEQGARRWRDAIGRIRNGGYGIDLVVIGDSTGTYGDWWSCWPYFLRNMLQERFNDPAVKGGFGFIPIAQSNYGYSLSGGFASLADPCPFRVAGNWNASFRDPIGNAATGLVQLRQNVAGSTSVKIYGRFDPTSSFGSLRRFGIESFEFVGLLYPNVSDRAYIDHSTGVGPLASSNVVTPSQTLGMEWGQHWPRQSGLDPTVAHTIQVAVHANNAGGAAGQVWANGFILYNGDYNEGVRTHNLSNVGTTSNEWAADDASHLNLIANIDQFSTASDGGARNAKCFLINLIINDNGYLSAGVPLATFKANLQALIARITTRPSRPCVGFNIMVPPQAYDGSTGADPARLLSYPQYIDAIYKVVEANTDTCFIATDQAKVLYDSAHPTGYAPHGTSSVGAMKESGFFNDGIHGNAVYQQTQARRNFAALTWGI